MEHLGKYTEGTFYIETFRVFSGRKVNVECGKEKDRIINKLAEVRKSSNMLGPIEIKRVFLIQDGKEITYEVLYSKDKKIVDIIEEDKKEIKKMTA